MKKQDLEYYIYYNYSEGLKDKIIKVTYQKAQDKTVVKKFKQKVLQKRNPFSIPKQSNWKEIVSFLESRVQNHGRSVDILEELRYTHGKCASDCLSIEFPQSVMPVEKKVWLTLEYLRKNTDASHRIMQKEIAEYFEAHFPDENAKLKSPNSLRTFIERLAYATNLNEMEEAKPQSEWRVVHDSFEELYRENELDEWEEESEDADVSDVEARVENIYYNPEFSYDEIDTLIEALRFSPAIDRIEAGRLTRKIEEYLTSRYYKQGVRNICSFKFTEPENKGFLRQNLLTIQTAIRDRVRIQFTFNGFDQRGRMKERYSVEMSLYDILACMGHYYVYGYVEKHRNASIWRVDLMTNLVIPERREDGLEKGVPQIPRSKVEGVVKEWTEKVSYEHLYMAFDDPVEITLRVANKKREGTLEPEWPSYNFMMDSFGKNWTYAGVDQEDKDYDIVKVKCSPWAMSNWALQYADRVEVIEPEEVRTEVEKKVRELVKKYGLEGKSDD